MLPHSIQSSATCVRAQSPAALTFLLHSHSKLEGVRSSTRSFPLARCDEISEFDRVHAQCNTKLLFLFNVELIPYGWGHSEGDVGGGDDFKEAIVFEETAELVPASLLFLLSF